MAGLSGFVIAILVLVTVGSVIAGQQLVAASPLYLVPAIGFWFLALLALVGVGLIAAILATKEVRVITMVSGVIAQPPARQRQPPPASPARRDEWDDAEPTASAGADAHLPPRYRQPG